MDSLFSATVQIRFPPYPRRLIFSNIMVTASTCPPRFTYPTKLGTNKASGDAYDASSRSANNARIPLTTFTMSPLLLNASSIAHSSHPFPFPTPQQNQKPRLPTFTAGRTVTHSAFSRSEIPSPQLYATSSASRFQSGRTGVTTIPTRQPSAAPTLPSTHPQYL